MCGILLLLSAPLLPRDVFLHFPSPSVALHVSTALPQLLTSISSRGPDTPATSQSCTEVAIPYVVALVDSTRQPTTHLPELHDACSNLNSLSFTPLVASEGSEAVINVHIRLWVTVLHMRGEWMCKQPLVLPSYKTQHHTNLFAWNGEAYAFGEYGASAESCGLALAYRKTEPVSTYAEDTEAGSLIKNRRSQSFLQLNDTVYIGEALQHCKNEKEILALLDTIDGPFAFVYYAADTQQLWFGRDKLGRRSLLFAYTDEGLCISSVGSTQPPFLPDSTVWLEVPVGGVYMLHFPSIFQNQMDSSSHTPFLSTDCVRAVKATYSFQFKRWPSPPPFESPLFWPLQCSSTSFDPFPTVHLLLGILKESVMKRICYSDMQDIHLGVLFSGGLDSTVLTALLLEQVPHSVCVELLNVSFDPFLSSDRLTALSSYAELLDLYPSHDIKLICIDVKDEELLCAEERVLGLISPLFTHMDFNIGLALYFASQGIGRLCDKDFVDSDWWKQLQSNGFEDVLLKKADFWDSNHFCCVNSDKVNAPLLNPQRESTDGQAKASVHLNCFLCQRKAKVGCAHKACSLCCRKLRNLSSCDSAKDSILSEWVNSPPPHLSIHACVHSDAPLTPPAASFSCAFSYNRPLPSPFVYNWEVRSTLLDPPDTTLFYVSPYCHVHKTKNGYYRKKQVEQGLFSDEGKPASVSSLPDPFLYYEKKKERFGMKEPTDDGRGLYSAKSRILLLGTGADELLGGYGRYQTARRRDGSYGIREEMLKDLKRLWYRNLGRDDRCVSAHGREARHPYLDEAFIKAMGELSIAFITGESMDYPPKWLLRAIAKALGLHKCSVFKKKAIQFGCGSNQRINQIHCRKSRDLEGTDTYIPCSVRGV